MTNDEKKQYKAILKDLAAKGNVEEFEKVKNEYIQARDAKPVDYQFGQSASNFFPSLGQAFLDIGTAVMNPIDTATTYAKLAQSGVANLGQAVEDALPENVLSNINKFTNTLGLPERATTNVRADRVPNQEMGEDVAVYYGDRYGSMDALKTTAMEDPAGLLLDLSSVFTGGGAALAKTGGKVGAVGEKIADVGRKIDPISNTIKAPGALFEVMKGQPMSRALYQSAMKPSTTIPLAKRNELLDIGLELGVTPTARNIDKLSGQRDQLFNEISTFESQMSGAPTIPRDALFTKVSDVRKDFAAPKMFFERDAKLIDDTVKAQMAALDAIGAKKLTVNQVAEIKRDIYKNVKFDRKNRTSQQAVEETQKAIAKAAKEAIEKEIPEIAEFNKVYGKLSEVQNKLQIPANKRLGNRDLLSLGAPIKAGVGNLLGGIPGAAMGVSAALDVFPSTKANAAIQLNQVGKIAKNRYTQGILQGISLGGREELQALGALDEEIEREMAQGE